PASIHRSPSRPITASPLSAERSWPPLVSGCLAVTVAVRLSSAVRRSVQSSQTLPRASSAAPRGMRHPKARGQPGTHPRQGTNPEQDRLSEALVLRCPLFVGFGLAAVDGVEGVGDGFVGVHGLALVA